MWIHTRSGLSSHTEFKQYSISVEYVTSHTTFVVWLFGHARASAMWKYFQLRWRGQWLEQWPSGRGTDRELPPLLTKRAHGTSPHTPTTCWPWTATYLLCSPWKADYPQKSVYTFSDLELNWTVVGLGKSLWYFSDWLLAWNGCGFWLGVHTFSNILCVAGPSLKQNCTYFRRYLLWQLDDMGF